jgi:hypothetical protein
MVVSVASVLSLCFHSAVACRSPGCGAAGKEPRAGRQSRVGQSALLGAPHPPHSPHPLLDCSRCRCSLCVTLAVPMCLALSTVRPVCLFGQAQELEPLVTRRSRASSDVRRPATLVDRACSHMPTDKEQVRDPRLLQRLPVVRFTNGAQSGHKNSWSYFRLCARRWFVISFSCTGGCTSPLDHRVTASRPDPERQRVPSQHSRHVSGGCVAHAVGHGQGRCAAATHLHQAGARGRET